jgi:hypothetical protein
MVITQAELSALGIITGSTITEIQFNKTNAANFNTPATSYKMYIPIHQILHWLQH